MQGFSLEHSLASFRLDPDEDLNKLSDEELARKKGQMDKLFEKNRRHKDDPDFVYDLEVDFIKSTQERCSWDESDDGFWSCLFQNVQNRWTEKVLKTTVCGSHR